MNIKEFAASVQDKTAKLILNKVSELYPELNIFIATDECDRYRIVNGSDCLKDETGFEKVGEEIASILKRRLNFEGLGVYITRQGEPCDGGIHVQPIGFDGSLIGHRVTMQVARSCFNSPT